jgi:NAD(P)-dependent dehydrogenase (short-subunit alcohol dehydrogenase family)
VSAGPLRLELQGKVVLVTGGSSGIGRATVARLLQEGARVATCARDAARLERAAAELRAAHGGELLAVPADVSTAAGVERIVDATLAQYGTLHGLVNNAGSSAAGPFAEITDAQWEADLALKLLGPVRLARRCLPALCATRGAIVNVVAIGGKAPPARSMPSAVTRAAGLAFTKALAQEYAPQQVRVNAVCIGVVRSAQQEHHWQREYPHLDRESFYVEWARRRAVPLGRIGYAEEVADLIAFLLSERAGYITGTAINIDGGLSPVW